MLRIESNEINFSMVVELITVRVVICLLVLEVYCSAPLGLFQQVKPLVFQIVETAKRVQTLIDLVPKSGI